MECANGGGFRSAVREGMSLVEALIMVMVVTIAVGVLMTTLVASLNVLAASREDLAAHTLASNWFEAFESFDAGDAAADFEETLALVARRLDPSSKGRGSVYSVRGYEVRASRGAAESGLLRVNIAVTALDAAKKEPLLMSKVVNTFSNDTVSNDLQ